MSVLTRQSYYGCSKTGVPTTWMREETRDVIMAHKERFVDVLNENKLQTNMVISSVTRNYFLKVSRFNFFSEMLKKTLEEIRSVTFLSVSLTFINLKLGVTLHWLILKSPHFFYDAGFDRIVTFFIGTTKRNIKKCFVDSLKKSRFLFSI